MNMTQVWPFVAIAAAVIAVVFRQMSLQRSELKTEIAGVRNELKPEIAGVRNELKTEIVAVRNELRAEIRTVDAKVDGLRNELVGILQPMSRTLERLDQEVLDHLKVPSAGG